MADKILITGGAGFIGSHVADLLLEKGHDVVVLDSLHPQVHGEEQKKPDYLSNDVEFIKGDCADPVAVRASMKGVSRVLHLAARVGVGQSMYDVHDYCYGNTATTARFLETVFKTDLARIVVASSMSIYGEGLYRDRNKNLHQNVARKFSDLKNGKWEPLDDNGNDLIPIPTTEDKTPDLSSVYALTKYDQERLTLMLAKSHGVSATALRFFNVYGTRQALSNPYTGVLAIFASRLLNQQPPLIYEDGRQLRDFINVKDIANACYLALTSDGLESDVLNIGNGQPRSILEIYSALSKAMNLDLEPEIIQKFRHGDIRHCYGDISQVKSELSFDPEISFDEGIRNYVEWLGNQSAIDNVIQAQSELHKRGLVT